MRHEVTASTRAGKAGRRPVPQLSRARRGGIIQVGGTFLAAQVRGIREESGAVEGAAHLAQRRHRWRGGDRRQRSQTGSYLLSQLGVDVGRRSPSTIDNDLLGTDVTIGCDTASNVTLEAIDHLRTTVPPTNRAFLVEKRLGRDCGYLAMMRVWRAARRVISTRSSKCPPAIIARRLHAATSAQDPRDRMFADLAQARAVKE